MHRVIEKNKTTTIALLHIEKCTFPRKKKAKGTFVYLVPRNLQCNIGLHCPHNRSACAYYNPPATMAKVNTIYSRSVIDLMSSCPCFFIEVLSCALLFVICTLSLDASPFTAAIPNFSLACTVY